MVSVVSEGRKEWDMGKGNAGRFAADVVTERDKLHLVMQVADEIGRRYGMDPRELWGAGWEGIRIAETKFPADRGGFLPFARKCISLELKHQALHQNGRRRTILTGSM